MPQFVEREMLDFINCGVLAKGFARFHCEACAREILVAFSCNGRGICPSCGGRRMAELAAHLVDGVLGGLPIRQWVLTLPHRLRYALAWDHRLCRRVLAVFIRAVLGFERRRARDRGVEDGVGGAVTAIQRFGSALNTNVHFHTLVAQGVFFPSTDGTIRFAPAPAPSDGDVARLLGSVRRRILRLVARHGIDLEDPSAAADSIDERLFDCPTYAQIQGAAVVGRVATGARAGAAVMRLGSSAESTRAEADNHLQAHLDGFDLHAAVVVPAGDRGRLEHLCRYILRPPVAQGSLSLTSEGKVVLRLRRAWRDGTRALVFEPTELLEKLAAIVPKPRINLLLYHGAFAPHACRRAAAVSRAIAGARTRADDSGCGLDNPHRGVEAVTREVPQPAENRAPAASGGGKAKRKYIRWAELLERSFAIDVLACPECGGRLRLIATIEQRSVIDRILSRLGLPTTLPVPARARAPAEPGTDWTLS